MNNTIFKGMAMGIAEAIPGVSGGTIAFITGIYLRLIEAIKNLNLGIIPLVFKGKWNEAVKQYDLNFLITVLVGMFFGLILSVLGVSYFIEHYPPIIWSLFFGFILASVPLLGRSVSKWSIANIILFLLGGVVAFGVTQISPVEGNMALWYVFLCGFIAISALILPGISGSFILLLLGMYIPIFNTVKGFITSPDMSEFILIMTFGLGCIAGVLILSRVLSAVFKQFPDSTMALLSGFVLGSVIKLWPWQNPSTILNRISGLLEDYDSANYNEEHMKIVKQEMVLPSHYSGEPYFWPCVFAFLIGIILIVILGRFNEKEKMS